MIRWTDEQLEEFSKEELIAICKHLDPVLVRYYLLPEEEREEYLLRMMIAKLESINCQDTELYYKAIKRLESYDISY